MGAIIIDSAVLLLLLVGYADRSYILRHKRLNEYDEDDFDMLIEILRPFDEIIALPNTLTEVSSFGRHIFDPAKTRFQHKLRDFISQTREIYIESRTSSINDHFVRLGLTDASILSLCALMPQEVCIITVDGDLVNAASSLGFDVIDFRDFV